MTINLARVQVEILYPGAIIAGKTNIPMYLSPPRPFVVWPEKPAFKLEAAFDQIRILADMARFHIQTIGSEIDGITLGDLDFLLTLKTERELFEPFFLDFTKKAEKTKLESSCKKWCGIAAFDVNTNKDDLSLLGWVPLDMHLINILEE